MKDDQFWIIVGLLCYILAASEKNYYLSGAATFCGIVSFILVIYLIMKDKIK
jgi:hypothetical protein